MAEWDADILFVGRGYSVATYLAMADLTWAESILLVGGRDSWDKAIRGDGIINHGAFLYARDSEGRKDTDFKGREELADTNAQLIQTAAIDYAVEDVRTFDSVLGVVRAVRRVPYLLQENVTRTVGGQDVTLYTAGQTVQLFEVDYYEIANEDAGATIANKKTKTALKLVYGGGAGPHSPPVASELQALGLDYVNAGTRQIAYPDGARVIDLDSFMRLPKDSVEGATVAVVGPNAGLDAATRALDDGATLKWMIRGPKGTRPAWLPSLHYRIDGQTGRAAMETANRTIINYTRTVTVAWVDEGTKDKIRITIPEGYAWESDDTDQRSFVVDYYVFAIGQAPDYEELIDDKLARVGPAKALKPVLDAQGPLVPIYDINGRFGRWFETAFGLASPDRTRFAGLEVIGAAAFALSARSARQDYLNTERGPFGAAAAFNYGTQQDGTYLQPFPSRKNEPDPAFGRKLDTLKGLGFALGGETVRLFDYFLEQGQIPGVPDSFMNLPVRLNQRTVIAGDQLTTVRSQVAGITDFYPVAAGLAAKELYERAHVFLKTGADAVKAIGTGTDVQDTLLKLQFASFRIQITVAREQISKDLTEALALIDGETSAEAFALRLEATYQSLGAVFDQIEQDPQDKNTLLDPIADAQADVTDLLARLQVLQVGPAIDFNAADRTELAIYIAARYPDIPPTVWDGLTAKIVAGRANKPSGYTADDVAQIDQQLQVINTDPGKANTFLAP